ncbi:MAG: hypothetical protein ABSB56_03625 [Nitrososphaerales archaeon]
MPFKLFKEPAEKAEIEFREAYEKGVNLGPEKWPDAVQHFSEASKHYASIGNSQKSSEAHALATLFYALTTRTDQAWQACGQAMNQVPDSQLNVGFAVGSASLAQQASVLSYDMATTRVLDGNSKDVSRVAAVRDLAQKYMDLIGSDLALWRLQKQEIDPQKRAYYLLGLASLIEANSLADSDPKKSVALLSEAATNLELAGTDPMNVSSGTQAKLENISKFGQCWFCGREMQGQGFHYVLLPATVSQYSRQRYGSSTPHTMEGSMVVACESCSSSIQNVADEVARAYYERAMAEMRSLEKRLNAKIAALEGEIASLRARVNRMR